MGKGGDMAEGAPIYPVSSRELEQVAEKGSNGLEEDPSHRVLQCPR